MTITSELLTTNQKTKQAEALFGSYFQRQLIPMVAAFARKMEIPEDNDCWDYILLSNGGFYLKPPSSIEDHHVTCTNGLEGNLSPDALGIVICLMTYAYLFGISPRDINEQYYTQYNRLRDYSFVHPEAGLILASIE